MKHTNPKYLPCLHTFCLSCLQECKTKSEAKKNVVVCPICVQEFDLSSAGLDLHQLPTNFYIEELLKQKSFSQVLTNQLQGSCDICRDSEYERSDLTVMGYCFDCEQFLCKSCYKGHNNIAVAKSHTLRT